MVSFKSLVVTALISAAALTHAQSSSPIRGYSNQGSLFSAGWNIPASGQDVFLQLQGPTSAGWVATGIGSGMKDSLMFIIYQDGSGNITVSPRIGKGETEPKFESTIRFELLAGSGVQEELMTANIKCANCRSWDGGRLDVTSKDQNFIWAVGNQRVTSKSQSETLSKHVQNGRYVLDLTQATGGNSQNPFVSSDSADGTTSGVAGPGETGGSNSSGSNASGGSSSSGNGAAASTGSSGSDIRSGSSIAPPRTKADKVLIAHGMVLSLASYAFYSWLL